MSPEEKAFWDEFCVALKPEVPVIREYRLYYDARGRIYLCTNVQKDQPDSGDYVIVDQKTYDQNHLYRIVKGQVVKKEIDLVYRRQLQSSNAGFQVVTGHAGLIVESNEEYKNTEYYDRPDN